jgi:hypothetical protein
MKVFARSITAAVALAIMSQPCLAASGHSKTATAAEPTSFSLERQPGAASMASMTLAASQQTASETEEQPRRKAPVTTTLLIVGGVILLVVVVVAASSLRGPIASD